MGSSGQRSLTSKTIGTPSFLLAKTAGIAIVNGVLVAKIISQFKEVDFLIANKANLIKAKILLKKLKLLEYSTGYQ